MRVQVPPPAPLYSGLCGGLRSFPLSANIPASFYPGRPERSALSPPSSCFRLLTACGVSQLPFRYLCRAGRSPPAQARCTRRSPAMVLRQRRLALLAQGAALDLHLCRIQPVANGDFVRILLDHEVRISVSPLFRSQVPLKSGFPEPCVVCPATAIAPATAKTSSFVSHIPTLFEVKPERTKHHTVIYEPYTRFAVAGVRWCEWNRVRKFLSAILACTLRWNEPISPGFAPASR